MLHRTALCLPLALFACSAPYQKPQGLCEFPASLATWEHARVRWQGILLHSRVHGMLLIAEQCPGRVVTIRQWPGSQSDKTALHAAVQRSASESGIIRVDVFGRITGRRALAVSRVHRIEFEPMTPRQEAAFWNRQL